MVDGSKADGSVGRKDEDSWFGDASFFTGIVDVPLAYHVTLGVRQDWKGKIQVAAHGLGLIRRIHRNGHHIRAGGAEGWIEIAIFHQLAETEGSPVPAIEEKHKRSRSREPGEAPRNSGGIFKLEIRRGFVRLRGHRQQSYARQFFPVYLQYTSFWLRYSA